MSHVTWLTYSFSCHIWMTRSGATYKRVTSLNLTTHSQDARRTHVWRVSFLYVTVLSKNLRRQSEKHICNNTCMACLIRISRTHTHTHTHVTHTHTHTHAHTHTHTRTQVWWISFVHVCNIANVGAHCLLRFFESTVTIFRVWEHPESFEWNSEQILYSNLSLSLHVTFVQCHGAQPFLFCHVPVSSIKKKIKVDTIPNYVWLDLNATASHHWVTSPLKTLTQNQCLFAECHNSHVSNPADQESRLLFTAVARCWWHRVDDSLPTLPFNPPVHCLANTPRKNCIKVWKTPPAGCERYAGVDMHVWLCASIDAFKGILDWNSAIDAFACDSSRFSLKLPCVYAKCMHERQCINTL